MGPGWNQEEGIKQAFIDTVSFLLFEEGSSKCDNTLPAGSGQRNMNFLVFLSSCVRSSEGQDSRGNVWVKSSELSWWGLPRPGMGTRRAWATRPGTLRKDHHLCPPAHSWVRCVAELDGNPRLRPQTEA